MNGVCQASTRGHGGASSRSWWGKGEKQNKIAMKKRTKQTVHHALQSMSDSDRVVCVEKPSSLMGLNNVS